MQFICEICRANLQIADEKLRGKRLIVRCKRCGVQIRIADPALSEQSQSLPDDQATAKPRADPPPPPLQAFASEAAVWFAMVRKERTGPLTPAELQAKVAAGEVHPSTYLWKQGMEAWARAQTIADIASLFPAPPPPPVEDVAARAPASSAGSVLPFESSPKGAPAAPLESASNGSLGSLDPGSSSVVAPADDALDLARWGAAELEKPRAPTPIPSVAETESTSALPKREFRGIQSRRRGPLRAALLVLGAAAVASLAAFALLYERRDAPRGAEPVAVSSETPVNPGPGPKPSEPAAPQATAADVASHGTVPSPDVLKKKVEESMPALQGCVDEALQHERSLRVGKILILTTVAPSGEVTSARIDKKNVDQSQLGACLKSVARNIQFPSFSGEGFPLDIPVVVAGGE